MLAKALVALSVVVLSSCAIPAPPPDSEPAIDLRSYRLGSIAAFAEMVGAGVKRLALSSPMTSAEMDALVEEAERIAAENGALSYRENDFLTTDLFPAEITEGKEVLLIYLDPVKDEYMALKEEKAELVAAGRYEGAEREEIARRMGRLLSYSDERIDELLRENGTR